MLNIRVHKSTELTNNEWIMLANGFNRSFELERHHNTLKNYYVSNRFGYSYHAIALNESNHLVGHTSVIPYLYKINNKKATIGLSGGSFVLKEYRSDETLFFSLYFKLRAFCLEDKLTAIVGVPNKNSHKYFLRILRFYPLRDLNYYILPIRISKFAFRSNVKIINILYWIPGAMFLFINILLSLLVKTKVRQTSIEVLLDADYYRYRFSAKYSKYSTKNCSGVYLICEEKGINTAYIMDFREKNERTYKALVLLIIHIVSRQRPDAILFIGTLHLRQSILFKIPHKKIPQKFPLVVDPLTNNQDIQSTLKESKNWDFSLMNFDVR